MAIVPGESRGFPTRRRADARVKDRDSKMLNTMFRLAVLIACSAVYAVADPGLVAQHYTFEEGPGGAVKDASGNANDGRIVGDVTYLELADGTGYAMRFNAGNSYVDCGNKPSLDLKEAITIELWYRPEGSPATGNDAGLVGKGLDSYVLTYVPGACWWYVGGVGKEGDRLDVGGGAVAANSTWRHLAVTFDGKESRIYVDGELTGSRASDSKGRINTGGPFYLRYPLIYGNDKELPFVCMMDDVRVYNRALSAAELLEHYKKDRNWRKGLEDARWVVDRWRLDYNHQRPHSSLDYQTPAEFAARCCSSVRATPSLQNSSGPLTLDPLIKAGT